MTPFLVRIRAPLGLAFSAAASIQLLNVFTGVLLARSFGPQHRGELASLLLWPSFLASLGSLGITEAVTYFAARDEHDIGVVAGTALALGAAQSLVLVGLGAAIVPLALHEKQPVVVHSALLFLLFIPWSLLALYLMGVLNGLQRFAWFQALRVLTVFLIAAGLGGFGAAGMLTLRSAAAVYVVSSAIVAGAAVTLLRRGGVRLRIDVGLGRRLLWFGVKSHVTNVSTMLNERLDQLFISVFLPATQLGLYVVAVTLSSAATIVGAAVATVALPAVAPLRTLSARRSGARYLRVTLLLSTAMAVPSILLAPGLLEFFFGVQYGAAATVARILAVGGIAFSLNRVMAAILIARGRPLAAGGAETAALGVTLVTLPILLPVLGLTGAALASLLAYLSSTVWMFRQTVFALGGRRRAGGATSRPLAIAEIEL